MELADYEIKKCDDCYRVTYLNDNSLHTHCHSLAVCKQIVDVACGNGKIPLQHKLRFYESLWRILPDKCDFKCKVHDVMIAKSKKKDYYYNPKKKR